MQGNEAEPTRRKNMSIDIKARAVNKEEKAVKTLNAKTKTWGMLDKAAKYYNISRSRMAELILEEYFVEFKKLGKIDPDFNHRENNKVRMIMQQREQAGLDKFDVDTVTINPFSDEG